jgi:stage II sporulation protein R
MTKRLIILLMGVVLAFSFTFSGMSQTLERDDLIRLHVIANSDSPEDQALKLRVRDHLLLTFGEVFQDTSSMTQARAMINKSLSDFQQEAQGEILRQGYSYPVKVQLGIFPFPTKAYGDMVYPAGRYEALRVVIGQGSGANWWCVMFPPLCFVDVSSGAARRPSGNTEKPKTGKASAHSSDAIQAEKPDGTGSLAKNVPAASSPLHKGDVVYTFKLAEWWQSFKAWLSRIF